MEQQAKTAEELVAELEADPEWAAARAREEEEEAQAEEASRRAQRPLLNDLAAVGIDIDDVWEVKIAQPEGAGAIPVLLPHLTDSQLPVDVREGIARSLATTRAAPHWRALEDCLLSLRAEDDQLREALAATLSEVATKNEVPQVLNLLERHDLGRHRVFFLRTLTRLRVADRWQIIERYSADPELSVEAQALLRARDQRERPQR